MHVRPVGRSRRLAGGGPRQQDSGGAKSRGELRGRVECLRSGGENVRVVIAVVLWCVISSVLRRDEPLEPVDGQTFTEAAEAFVRTTAHALQIRPEPALVPQRQSAALYLTQEDRTSRPRLAVLQVPG